MKQETETTTSVLIIKETPSSYVTLEAFDTINLKELTKE